MARASVLTVLTGVSLLLAACGSDDADEGDEPVTSSRPTDSVESAEPDSADPTTSTGAHVRAGDVETFSSSEICDLVPAADVGAALGREVASVEPLDGGTPQCAYGWTEPDGTTTDVVLAVMRPVEDLGGQVGERGFVDAVEVNRRLAPGAEYQELEAIGDGAAWVSAEASSILLAWEDDQVVTVAASALNQEESAALAARLLGGIR